MIRDDFVQDRAPGTVVGSRAEDGTERRGVDAEGTMAIDNEALRIGFLERPGWGREEISYPPCEVEPGLAMGVLALNGHNSSRVHVEPVYGLLKRRLHALRLWLVPSARPPRLEENFAVGWSDGGDDGPPGGPTFAVRHVSAENADLCVRVLGTIVPVLRRLRDMPLLYAVVLRESGAMYYAASVADVPGLSALPRMRPLAIDPSPTAASLSASIRQSVLAEVGWRIDSRVYAVRAATVPELAAWFGSAHAADRLGGSGPLAGAAAEAGGAWSSPRGSLLRAPEGAGGSGLALLDPGSASGLIYARILDPGAGAGVLWRGGPDGEGLELRLAPDSLTLTATEGGAARLLASEPNSRAPGPAHLQILDDGEELTVLIDDAVALGGPLRCDAAAAGTAVGVHCDGGLIADFEAHPRDVPVPPQLSVPAPWDERGGEPAFVDRFEGPAGELGDPWRRREGKGRVLVSGSGGARIDGDRERPNPGRTIYTRPWVDPQFAETAIDQTPPGRAEGEAECGRVGLVFMQDPGNYLLVSIWLDDAYESASISSFLTLDGKEDHYAAVWSNVGRNVRWGVRSRLAIAFDGMRWTARLDGVPILHRSLSDVYPLAPRLRIAEVGFTANWEWGDDTGSLLHEFSARGAAS